MATRIVVVGSSNTDMIITTEKLPVPGETVIGGEFSMAPGGKGANQAVAAARAGGDVALVACVGNDIFGEKAVRGFVEDGIDVAHVFRLDDAPSGVALIFVGADGENSIAVASGANAGLSPRHIEKAKDVIVSADILLMQLETPIDTVRAAAELAAANGVQVILNPAPARLLDDGILKNVTVFTPNETEVEKLTGIRVESEGDAEKASASLLAGGIETVIITMGARGAYAATDGIRGLIPAFHVSPVDTTGAGDVFTGVLAVALGEGRDVSDAVRFANAAAALSTTILGAQPSAPHRDAIDAFLSEHD